MSRSRGITLKGEAARAFIEGAMGKPIVEDGRKELSDDDKRLVVGTKVMMFLKSGTKDESKCACALLQLLELRGLEVAYLAAGGK